MRVDRLRGRNEIRDHLASSAERAVPGAVWLVAGERTVPVGIVTRVAGGDDPAVGIDRHAQGGRVAAGEVGPHPAVGRERAIELAVPLVAGEREFALAAVARGA